jgi:hypothetical protein
MNAFGMLYLPVSAQICRDALEESEANSARASVQSKHRGHFQPMRGKIPQSQKPMQPVID